MTLLSYDDFLKANMREIERTSNHAASKKRLERNLWNDVCSEVCLGIWERIRRRLAAKIIRDSDLTPQPVWKNLLGCALLSIARTAAKKVFRENRIGSEVTSDIETDIAHTATAKRMNGATMIPSDPRKLSDLRESVYKVFRAMQDATSPAEYNSLILDKAGKAGLSDEQLCEMEEITGVCSEGRAELLPSTVERQARRATAKINDHGKIRSLMRLLSLLVVVPVAMVSTANAHFCKPWHDTVKAPQIVHRVQFVLPVSEERLVAHFCRK